VLINPQFLALLVWKLRPGLPGCVGAGQTATHSAAYAAVVQIHLVALIVEEYDPAIRFFTEALGFELVEDSPSLTNDGLPKRWVVVRSPGAQTGILLARADGEHQRAAVGDQVAGRVGFFLRVDDFTAAYDRMAGAGVTFVSPPRSEPYGQVAIFLDIAGNRWDLLGPPA
jgi:catechol 2,3-dioxygenase-like lactoylglutathione lyase family enzyme